MSDTEAPSASTIAQRLYRAFAMNGTHIVSVAYLTGHIDGPCTVITLEGPCYRTFEVYNKANDGEVWTIRKYVDPECVVNEIEWPVDRVTAGSMVRLLNMWRKFR